MSQLDKLRETTPYTLGFVLVMCLIVAGGLAFLKQLWGDQQKANELNFTKEQILTSVIDDMEGIDVETIFSERVTGKVINAQGEIESEEVTDALDIELYKESKKSTDKRRLPFYTYTNEDGEERYIMPTVGKGLWDQIMSYVALESDKNTIAGITFDHVAETPGLGAKIKDDPTFYEDFVGEQILDAEGVLVGVLVRKGNNDPNNADKSDHTIDAISGATITGDGVEDMLQKELKNYLPYLNKQTES